MVIICPCAGIGSRFQQEGFTRPKPLIDVGGLPMIGRVIESIKDLEFFNAKLILIMQHSHLAARYEDSGYVVDGYYLVNKALKQWNGYKKVIEIDGLTEGAVSTTLLASKYIENEEELIILNSDQYLDTDLIKFVNYSRNFDGCLMTFPNKESKWSYCEVNEYNGDRLVDKVEEKVHLPGDHANVGFYWWKTGYLYLNAAASMIEKNIRVNNEFYIAKIYCELLRECRISNYEIFYEEMFPMGTPVDLLESAKKKNWIINK